MRIITRPPYVAQGKRLKARRDQHIDSIVATPLHLLECVTAAFGKKHTRCQSTSNDAKYHPRRKVKCIFDVPKISMCPTNPAVDVR